MVLCKGIVVHYDICDFDPFLQDFKLYFSIHPYVVFKVAIFSRDVNLHIGFLRYFFNHVIAYLFRIVLFHLELLASFFRQPFRGNVDVSKAA